MIEFIFEVLLEVLIEALFELGIYSVEVVYKREPRPVLAFFGYLIIGTVCGFLSLLVFKDYFVTDKDLMLVNLFLSPLIAGTFITLLGRFRAKKGKKEIQLDRFLYGFSFAFMIALVRYTSLIYF